MPPYGRLAGVIVTGPDEPRTWDVARALARAAEPLRAVGAELWGPAPAPIARIRGRHRVRMLVRAAEGRGTATGAARLGRRGARALGGAGDGRRGSAELLLTVEGIAAASSAARQRVHVGMRAKSRRCLFAARAPTLR